MSSNLLTSVGLSPVVGCDTNVGTTVGGGAEVDVELALSVTNPLFPISAHARSGMSLGYDYRRALSDTETAIHRLAIRKGGGGNGVLFFGGGYGELGTGPSRFSEGGLLLGMEFLLGNSEGKTPAFFAKLRVEGNVGFSSHPDPWSKKVPLAAGAQAMLTAGISL